MTHTITLDDGTEVPQQGFGTFGLDGPRAVEAIRLALEVGYRHLDTAQSYGNEAEVGQALRDSGLERDDVFVTTKIMPSNAAAKDVRRSTEASLRELRTDHVDLLLLHWPAEHVAPLGETLEAMTSLRDAELTRTIGVSNFPSVLLERAFSLAPVVTDQVEHHPYLAVDAIAEVLQRHGGFLTAYCPVVRGQVNDDPVLQEIAAAHGVTPTQVTLRWLLQQPATVPIPRSGDPERIRANFEVDGFELDDDEVARIDALDRDYRLVNPDGAPAWD